MLFATTLLARGSAQGTGTASAPGAGTPRALLVHVASTPFHRPIGGSIVMPTAPKKSRAGKKFSHGDDLTKTREDAKRTSSTQSWEKKGHASKK
jgi:hypothetical protein